MKNLTNREEILKRYAAGERDLSSVSLLKIDLHRASLEGANFSGSVVVVANFAYADIRGANLSGTTLKGSDFYGANLKGANLSNVKNMYNCFFKYADLSGADLSDADLSGANFNCAALSGAKFCGAKYYGLKFSPNVKNTFVEGTPFSRDTYFLSDGNKTVVICDCFIGLLSDFEQRVNSKPEGCPRKVAYIAMIEKFLNN